VSSNKIILALLLILAGAISNFIDRLLFGFVIDYLAFFSRSYLNLADLMIAAGMLILISSKISPRA
jgi:signal peptidase II